MPADETLAAIADLRVLITDVAADVRAIRVRLDQHDRGQADHENRLRAIETSGCPAGVLARSSRTTSMTDVEARLRSLERWRWSIPSVTVVVAVASLGVAAWVALH